MCSIFDDALPFPRVAIDDHVPWELCDASTSPLRLHQRRQPQHPPSEAKVYVARWRTYTLCDCCRKHDARSPGRICADEVVPSSKWIATTIPSHEPVAAGPLCHPQRSCWFWLHPRRFNVLPSTPPDNKSGAISDTVSQRRRSDSVARVPQPYLPDKPRHPFETIKRR